MKSLSRKRQVLAAFYLNEGDNVMNAFPYMGAGSEGMSLRDYFAAKMMPELNWVNAEISAKECYRVADAMMKARQEGEQE